MIDKRNGHIIISPDVELAPNDSFDKIKKLDIGENQEVHDMKTGYKWLDLQNVKIDNEYFIFSFCFFNDKLEMLRFVVDNKKFVLKENWDSWTEEEERANERKYKKWVIDKLGHEGQFSWGQISALYDSKGGSSSIFLKYDLNRNE
jgi:hypothetical protein